MGKIAIVLMLMLALCACGDTDPSYFTNHGMAVTVGLKNKPGPRTVEKWTDFTIIFWRFFYPSWLACMNDSIAGIHAYFYDEDFVVSDGSKVGGYAERSLDIHTSNGHRKKVRAIFIHELSHVFVGECGGVWNSNGSHAVFDELFLDPIAESLP